MQFSSTFEFSYTYITLLHTFFYTLKASFTGPLFHYYTGRFSIVILFLFLFYLIHIFFQNVMYQCNFQALISFCFYFLFSSFSFSNFFLFQLNHTSFFFSSNIHVSMQFSSTFTTLKAFFTGPFFITTLVLIFS